MRRTKIVCTIGPATSSPEALRSLAESGMNVARINLSHGTHEQHAEVIGHIRRLSNEMNRPMAILLDLSGPKVRTGVVEGDGVELVEGRTLTLTSRDIIGTSQEVGVSIPELVDKVPVGSQLLLDDGTLELVVTGRGQDELATKVVTGGVLKSRKGVNAPGVSLPISAITDKDLSDLAFGIDQKVDWVATSFIRSAEDVAIVRGFCKARRCETPIIAKIEKHEAVSNIDEILKVVDGIMVARGDLGCEIPIHEVPVVQKMLIKKANAVGKPVITATQMLDSMIQNPRPTRAEVSDVANAIYDGTDAVMLSGETAVGQHPAKAVQMMDKIAKYTEASIGYKHLTDDAYLCLDEQDALTQSIAQATCDIAQSLPAAAIITATSSGRTAFAVSRYRPASTIIAATSRPEIVSRLALVWGVRPFLVGSVKNSDQMMKACIDLAQESDLVKDGDLVVITGGVPVGGPGNTNFVNVLRIGQPLFQHGL
jgi:pyruvate kinase